MNRRQFIGSSIAAACATSALAGKLSATPVQTAAEPHAKAKRNTAGQAKLGWELGTQAWTFRDRTCFEALETAQALGLTCVELFSGQQLSPASKDVTVGPGMSATHLAELKAKLKSCGVRAHSFGVVSPGHDEKAYRDIFAFAKSLDMRGITCEPPLTDAKDPKKLDAWKLIDQLTKETGLYAACHNHPKPSTYWNPDTVVGAIKGYDSKLIGACADTGHWTRSELVPADCLKKYDGRILELHFKDVKNDSDQPWGTGSGDTLAQLTELKRQKFKGSIFVEYESGEGKTLEANVAKCIEWFDSATAKLA